MFALLSGVLDLSIAVVLAQVFAIYTKPTLKEQLWWAMIFGVILITIGAMLLLANVLQVWFSVYHCLCSRQSGFMLQLLFMKQPSFVLLYVANRKLLNRSPLR